MRIFFILILLLLLAILFFANYFFYATLAKFFEIASPALKRIILFGSLFLSLSFIAATILAHSQTSAVVKYYYALSATWLGVLMYSLIGFGLVWFLAFLSKKAAFPLNMRLILIAALLLVGSVVIYGLMNNTRFRITRLSVSIDGLPEIWQGKTIAQISDLHLGVINGTAYARKVVGRLNALKPDIIFITGDYFDGTSPRFADLAAPLSGLEAPYGTYFVTGNHETYASIDKITAALKAAGVKVLKDEIVEIDGLNIVGADYPVQGMNKDLNPLLGRIDPDKPAILLYHEPRYLDLAKARGVDLQLSGHTHGGQLWPIALIDRLLYGKYYYGFYQDNGFATYTTSGTGSWGPPMRVGTRSEIVLLRLEAK